MRIHDDYNAAMWDLLMYGSCVLRVTTGPDKPQHIFAGRNDIGDTMTRPVFDVDAPIPGYKDAPAITAEQMSRFLYSHIGRGYALKIAKALNEARYLDFAEALPTTYVAPKPVEPPKPTFLPIDRPVRTDDVEAGDILRFCGTPGQNYFVENGYLTLGKEYTVGPGLLIDYDVVTKRGTKAGHWGGGKIMPGWSFVRRPGFAKVRDGYVKNGDTVWWLGYDGPENGVVGDAGWEQKHRNNIQAFPCVYQKAEPAKEEGYKYFAYREWMDYAPEGAL